LSCLPESLREPRHVLIRLNTIQPRRPTRNAAKLPRSVCAVMMLETNIVPPAYLFWLDFWLVFAVFLVVQSAHIDRCDDDFTLKV
jgi:hypothetical protein